MRLWSIHPRCLDRQGLLALWREGLLAQKVLTGKTKGYKFHPQLIRFREGSSPLALIGSYLHHVAEEAKRREYTFDDSKILKRASPRTRIAVSRGQLKYETEHLLKKLNNRTPPLYKMWARKSILPTHPLFRSFAGGIAAWEKITKVTDRPRSQIMRRYPEL